MDAPAHDGGTGTTRYRVARGLEYWGEEPVDVLKVQVEYDRAISGRRSPSYPIEQVEMGWGWQPVRCPEFDEVVEAAENLLEPVRSFLITWDREANTPDISKAVDDVLEDLVQPSREHGKRAGSIKVPCRSVRIVELEGSSAETWGTYFTEQLEKRGVVATEIRLTIVKIFGNAFVRNPIKS